MGNRNLCSLEKCPRLKFEKLSGKKKEHFEMFGEIKIPETYPVAQCNSICQYCNMALFQ